MQRMKQIILMIVLFLMLVGCKKKDVEKLSLEESGLANVEVSEQEDLDSTENAEYIFVHVCGAVNAEGVYELPSGSRVYEAIEVAGGFREDADTKNVNQAEILEDEERIYVPLIGETVQTELASDEDGKININKASKEELMTLPGVGESRADSIIKYREDTGAFQSIEDIMNVSGIKEGLFEKIRDLITI